MKEEVLPSCTNLTFHPTLSLDLEIVTREPIDQECHEDETKDNRPPPPGKGYLNWPILLVLFLVFPKPDDKLELTVSTTMMKKEEARKYFHYFRERRDSENSVTIRCANKLFLKNLPFVLPSGSTVHC